MTTEQKTWTHAISPSFISMNIEELKKMEAEKTYDIFGSTPNQEHKAKALMYWKYIWNNLFWGGTNFDTSYTFYKDSFEEFIDSVSRMISFPGLDCAHRMQDERKQRLNALSNYCFNIKERRNIFDPHISQLLSLEAEIVWRIGHNYIENETKCIATDLAGRSTVTPPGWAQFIIKLSQTSKAFS